MKFEAFKDRVNAAVQLVRLHHNNPIEKAWVINGFNDRDGWSRTPDQTLIRVIAEYIGDALLKGPDTVDHDPVFGRYYPVKRPNGELVPNPFGLKNIVLHTCKPHKSRVCVHADGVVKHVGWFVTKEPHVDAIGKAVSIATDGKRALVY